MFFDNIILFLNVLEQFAIRVEIFGLDHEDIIKYVNNLFYTSDDDYLKDISIKTDGVVEDPYTIIREAKSNLDKKIITDTLFQKLEYKYDMPTFSIKFII
jgi:hypothetical protein